MTIRVEEFARYREWLARAIDRYMPTSADLPVEKRPLNVLDELARRSPSKARQGLATAVRDILEATSHLSIQELRSEDDFFAQWGLPGLTQLRVRFWKQIEAILKRGKIRSDAEFYAVRNVLDADAFSSERPTLAALLHDFEFRDRPPRR